MSSDLLDSVVLISSDNPQSNDFGTGFVIHWDMQTCYLLTCAHVVDKIGGVEQVRVEGKAATLTAMSKSDDLDLAILSVEGLDVKPPLRLAVVGEKGNRIQVIGFQRFDSQRFAIRQLGGELGGPIFLESRESRGRISAWDIKMRGDFVLEPGYSGSPVIHEESSSVVGIATHRAGMGDKGVAVSILAVKKLWVEMPPNLLSGSSQAVTQEAGSRISVMQPAIRDLEGATYPILSSTPEQIKEVLPENPSMRVKSSEQGEPINAFELWKAEVSEKAKQQDISTLHIPGTEVFEFDRANNQSDWQSISVKLDEIRKKTEEYRQKVEDLLQKDVSLVSHLQYLGQESSNLNTVKDSVRELDPDVRGLVLLMRHDPQSFSEKMDLHILWGQLIRRWEGLIKSQVTFRAEAQTTQRLLKETHALTEQTITILYKAKDQIQDRYNIADLNVFLQIQAQTNRALNTISDAIEQFKNAQLFFDRMKAMLDNQPRS